MNPKKEDGEPSLEPDKLICNVDELPFYTPPGHWGTQNVRLVEGNDTGAYEMILGNMAAEGGSERHVHDKNYQAMFILEGVAMVELGASPPKQCPAGSVIRIPPGLDHRITAGGKHPLRLIVVFSPPLEPL